MPPSLAVACALAQVVAAQAVSTPSAPAPRFVDFRLGVADGALDGNVILRQLHLIGGASYDALDRAPDVAAFGALLRPSGGDPDRGEIIFGGNYLARADRDQWEVQAKYISPGGIGLGGGLVERDADEDTWFVNAIARGRRDALNYHFSPLMQHGSGQLSVGGYVALYTDHLFLSGGGDGEEWRVLGAWSANDPGGVLDPSIEILYVDQDVGRQEGEKFLFVNGSLKRNMGFLNTGSRLGRALGPQGLQFSNPVSFLSQPWSRTVDVWETGEIMNIRLARRALPYGTVSTLAQAVVFPVQALGTESRIRGLFAGVQYERDAVRSHSLLFGHAGRFGRASVNVATLYNIEQGDFSGAFGVKLYF